jgi:hypothetical protein
MAEERNVQHLVDQAQSAAMAGNLAAADELLRSAARIQEDELGPVHPDLTGTLSNLAIVAEKAGRLGDAETFYRRAAAIAAASLPADHPTVADSKKNLEDFCRERGLPIERAVHVASTETQRTQRTNRILPWAAVLGLVTVIAGALLVTRNPPARETTMPVATPAPEATKPPEPQAPPVTTTPAREPEPQRTPPARSGRATAASVRRAAAAISLTTAELCKTLSTSGDRWRCEPAGDPAARGRIVLYTRVKSPRNTTVVHRWYQGAALQQSVRLNARASVTEGYRTYSQLTIKGPGKWRVEVRSADGDLLFEKSFAVR